MGTEELRALHLSLGIKFGSKAGMIQGVVWHIRPRRLNRADIVPGAVFPDYELTDRVGRHRKLSDLQGPDAMTLALSRGAFCPKDRRQAEGLVQPHREMEVGYCRLVTMGTDSLSATNEYRTGVGAHWPFLSDIPRTIRWSRTPHPRTTSYRIQDLQRLLVLWPSNY